MFKISVVFPVYNNLPVVRVSLPAIDQQELPDHIEHEVIVIDDGSEEDMKGWLRGQRLANCRMSLFTENRGRAAARNAGVRASRGDAIIFLDSDVIVGPRFVQEHARALGMAQGRPAAHLQPRISIGRIVDTYSLDSPRTEPPTIGDFSLAHFPSANVAIGRKFLDMVQESPDGPFDQQRFTRYGWEDLELGYRLSKLQIKRVRNNGAIGFHCCPPFSLEQLPALLGKEIDRAKTANVFFEKHPTWEVRLMVQKTPFHRLFWELLSLGGLLNEQRLRPLLSWLIARGLERLAGTIARLTILSPTHIRHI